MNDLIGKTITKVESKEVGYDGDNAWEVVKITCSDGSEHYYCVDNPACSERFYGTFGKANADMWNLTGEYANPSYPLVELT